MKKKLFMVWITLAFINMGAQAQDVTINSEEEFKTFLENSDNYLGKTVKLAKDLNFSTYAQNSIHGKTTFSGTFDGQGHTISYITSIAQTGAAQGLFKTLSEGGKILNLNIDNLNINTNSNATGILTGQGNGEISNCFINNSTLTVGGNGARSGILIGKMGKGASINNCYLNNCKIIFNGNTPPSDVGIILGYYDSGMLCSIKNCYVIGSIIDNNIQKKGLIVGNIHDMRKNLKIINCYASPQVGDNISLTGFDTSIHSGILDSSSSLKDATFFANPESAWILNTTNATAANSNVWSHDGIKPVFADATQGATVKAGQIDGTTQGYANGNKVIPANFNYITFNTGNSEISDYSALEITPSNPNALIYLPVGATLNKNNAVIGDQCANLVLTDGHDFVCPTAFTATNAKYTRNCYTDGGWETIVLPFGVTDIKVSNSSVKDKYTIEEYIAEGSTGNTVKFASADTWTAGKAYIIKYNENKGSDSKQTCVFSGTGTIAATPADKKVKGTYTLISHTDAKGNYILNSTGTTFNKIGETAVSIPAFRAYLKGTQAGKVMQYSVIHGEGGATGIESPSASTAIYAANGAIVINSDTMQTIDIYSIDGRRVQSVIAQAGVTTINDLAQGIYIVNNQKIIIK